MLTFGSWVCVVLFTINLIRWSEAVYRGHATARALAIVCGVLLALGVGFYVGDLAVSGAQ